MGLALSTAWNSFRCNNASELLSEIKNIGFDSLELGFSLTSSMVAQIETFVNKGEIKVVSLHNFCPIPTGFKKEGALPDYYSMSSLDEEQRLQSIKYTKITIDTAKRLDAKVVVLHCGRVEVTDRTRKLVALLGKGKKGTSKYNQLKDDILKERQTLYKPYLENTFRSLEELCSYAGKMGIFLGIENRIYIREIPAFEEIGLILERFKGSRAFYWHDTGHAQVLENLGLNKHREYLDSYKNNLIGVHLHDCTATRDHQAPAKGEIDFTMLNPYINKETVKVIEAHYPSTAQDLMESKRFLEEIFDGRL